MCLQRNNNSRGLSLTNSTKRKFSIVVKWIALYNNIAPYSFVQLMSYESVRIIIVRWQWPIIIHLKFVNIYVFFNVFVAGNYILQQLHHENSYIHYCNKLTIFLNFSLLSKIYSFVMFVWIRINASCMYCAIWNDYIEELLIRSDNLEYLDVWIFIQTLHKKNTYNNNFKNLICLKLP